MEFTSADYNQIEMRVAAYLAGETELLEAFDRGIDIHTATWSLAKGIPVSEVTKKQRDMAKFIVYGLNYGRGAPSIAAEYKMTITEARTFISDYFKRFLRTKAWRQKLVMDAQRYGYLANAFGRRRYFFSGHIPKMYNFPPQSTGADILLEAMARMHPQLPRQTRMVLTVHDHLLLEHPPELRSRVVECIHDVMESPVDVLDGLVIPVKITHGKTWEECG